MSWKKKFVRNWGQLGMKCKLEDIVDVTMGQSPKSEYYNTEGKGYPFLQGNRTFGFKYPTFDTYTIVMTKQAKAGDVIMSVRAPVGNLNITPVDMCLGRGVCSLRMKNKNQDFLFYMMKYYVPHLLKKESGTVFGSVNRNDINGLEIDIPEDAQVQKKIARYLEMIDDKIELNNAINNNLEQQALSIFRQYFMDFVPYGGTVASDWTEVSLDDVCIRITDGSHYSPADSPDSPYPMYSVKDMEAYGFNSSTCKHITEEEFCKMQKSDCVPLLNDILVAKDGSYLKEIFICSEEKDEAILSSIAIFRPDTSVIIPEILLYLLKQPSVRKDVGDNYVSGSALPRIVLKDFKKYRFMLPPMEEQQKIGPALHAIRMQIKANIDEMHRLSSIRDILLPKLMSGEIDVSDINL